MTRIDRLVPGAGEKGRFLLHLSDGSLLKVTEGEVLDFSLYPGLELEEDPTPFLHSMTENTIKGWMYSPVTGGGTASVEFEYLTGFSTLFQPPHTVAYQLYVEEGMPSLAALAGSQGYETTAFHPYLSSGWNRPVAPGTHWTSSSDDGCCGAGPVEQAIQRCSCALPAAQSYRDRTSDHPSGARMGVKSCIATFVERCFP